MAITRSPVYCITLTFEDRDKNKATTEFFVDTGNTILEVITAITTYIVPRVQALSDAVCVGWSVNSAAVDSEPAVAAETSDVERKGIFPFQATNGAAYTLQIPSIKNTLVVDGSNVILTTQADVANFIELVTSPTLLALVRPRTYLGSDIVRIASVPTKKHRRSSKG